jgi:hypothetical protein
MSGGRRFLHRLARVEPGLLAIASKRSDQRRLAPADPGLQHQPVEAVVLGGAGPDGFERVLERRLHVVEVEVVAVRVVEHELVHPDGRGRAVGQGARDRRAFLHLRLQPHGFQDWQHVGEGRGAVRTIDLEPEAGAGCRPSSGRRARGWARPGSSPPSRRGRSALLRRRRRPGSRPERRRRSAPARRPPSPQARRRRAPPPRSGPPRFARPRRSQPRRRQIGLDVRAGVTPMMKCTRASGASEKVG